MRYEKGNVVCIDPDVFKFETAPMRLQGHRNWVVNGYTDKGLSIGKGKGWNIEIHPKNVRLAGTDPFPAEVLPTADEYVDQKITVGGHAADLLAEVEHLREENNRLVGIIFRSGKNPYQHPPDGKQSEIAQQWDTKDAQQLAGAVTIMESMSIQGRLSLALALLSTIKIPANAEIHQ